MKRFIVDIEGIYGPFLVTAKNAYHAVLDTCNANNKRYSCVKFRVVGPL